MMLFEIGDRCYLTADVDFGYCYFCKGETCEVTDVVNFPPAGGTTYEVKFKRSNDLFYTAHNAHILELYYWNESGEQEESPIDWASVHKDKDLCPRCKEDGKIVELIEKISEYAGAIKKCPKCGWC